MMKVPVNQRKRLRFKSLDKTWRRLEVTIELQIAQLQWQAKHNKEIWERMIPQPGRYYR
jgi:hypothetical protein